KYEMLKRTHTIDAPWTVVRSNNKHLARLNAIKVILNAVPCARLDSSLDFALDEQVIVSGSRELEMMEVERVRSGKFTD
ncbi:MAG: polyphosphate kinase 2, partial [Gammaproteobacteria bacterium]